MKNKRHNFPIAMITKKGEDFITSGNSWIYADELISLSEKCNSGDIVDVLSLNGKYLGSGFISNSSKIRIRIFSNNANDVFDDNFFKRRVDYAIDYRLNVLDNIEACRIIFGEADGFPGLTVDKYNDILVTQITTYGIDIRKNMIFSSLLEAFKNRGYIIKAIYERNDVSSRSLDGLELNKGYYYISKGFDLNNKETIIVENGIKYYVNYVEGQKTGFFLDQRFNRALVGKIAPHKRVLDLFTHTGSFGLNCAINKAKKVVSVDISALAIEQSKRNAILNNLQNKITYIKADVFDYLNEVRKREYDLIILDPPAFTKSRSTISAAYNGYKYLNAKAMSLLGRGGFLATCSCSHFMNDELFMKMLLEAAKENNMNLKQISYSQQGKDHPILLGNKQNDYLKFYILQLI